MDTLKDIRPNTLAITLRVSELEEIISRQVTQALQATPLWQSDLSKRQLQAVLAELSPEQTEQVLTFAIDLLVKASQPQEDAQNSEDTQAIVDTREADNEAQAVIGLAISNLMNGANTASAEQGPEQEDDVPLPHSQSSDTEPTTLMTNPDQANI